MYSKSDCDKVIESTVKAQYILTKGDDNNVDDRGLYGEEYIKRDDIVGCVVAIMPEVGVVIHLLENLVYSLFGIKIQLFGVGIS